MPAIGVKLSPGVDLAELGSYGGEVEFISFDGGLKEAVLWLGPLQTGFRRATILPSGVSLCIQDGNELQKLPVSAPQDYLYEPDPAILRAGLVQMVGAEIGGAQLDPDIAYLTTSQTVNTPFARCWAVADWFPFQLKRLRAYLRQRNVGKLTVKKRGSPLDPARLVQQLRLKGDESALIFLTHLEGKPIVIVAQEEVL